MPSIVEKWIDRADKVGTNLSAICRDLNISRSQVELFKKRLPKALNSYLSIEGHLEKLESERNKLTQQNDSTL